MKRILFLLLIAASAALGQTPTYQLLLKNDSLLSSTVYEFDVWLVNTSAVTFELATVQPVILYNTAITGGSLSFTIDNGSSGLNSTQKPSNGKLTISGNELRVAPNAPPGAGSGTIIPTSPGLRVGRFRLTSSVPFANQHANLLWKNSGTNPVTKVNAYDGTGTNVAITDSTGHLSQVTNGSLSPLVITTTSPLLTGSANQPYLDTILAQGGTAPYAWLVTGGALPSGVTLATNGILSGTPTASGTFNITAQVNDAASDSVSSPFSITINPGADTITASAGANGTIAPSGAVAVPFNGNQTFTFTPSTGYHVDSVVVDGVNQPAAPSYSFNNVVAPHTIRVTFAINTYTITPTAGANGTIAPATPTIVNYGSGQTFNFTPSTGYHVDSLIVDGVNQASAPSYTFSNVTANHTIRVTFAINQFTITPSAGANGTISPSVPTLVNYGANQAFTFTPTTGYHVDSLIIDGVNQSAATSDTFFNVTANHTIRVTFAINQYTLTPSAGANGTISPSVPTIVNYGGSQLFSFLPTTGYHVDSLIVDGVNQATAPSYTFSNVTANHTIRVTFAINQFTITASAGANGSIAPSGSVGVSFGGNQTFNFTPNTNFHVDSVIVDGVNQASAPSYTFTNVTANHTIRVTFATNSVSVTVQTNPPGNSVTVDGTRYVSSPQIFSWLAGSLHTISTDTVQAASSSTRLFWASWSDTTVNSHTVAPTVNTTYTANFKRQFFLTMTANPGGSVTPASSWRDSAAVVAITAFPSANYTFTDWSGSGTGSATTSNNPSSVQMGSAITEVANFVHNPVLVTVQTTPTGLVFYVDGFTKTSPYTLSFAPGQTHTIATDTIQNKTGTQQMVFKNWSDGGAYFHTINFPGNDTTFTATFKPQYFLTMNATAGGTVSPANAYIDSGAAVPISGTPQTGSLFRNWAGSGSGSYTGIANPSSVTMLSPITETGTFTLDTMFITASSGANGTIAPSGTVKVPYGGSQTFNFTPTTGYHVDSLIVDGVKQTSAPSYTFTNVTSAHTIRVTFISNTLTITASAGPNGSISPSGSVLVTYGASQGFTFTPTTGYHIDSVFVDGAYAQNTSPYTFNNVTTNHTINVTFAINQFTITATAGSNGSVAPSGPTIVNYGANQTFNFTPNTGYHADSVIVDGANQPSAPSYTFTNVVANHTLRVTFAPNTLSITVQTNPAGNSVTVDGTHYASSPQVFSWVAGSVHTISCDTIQGVTSSTRLVWTSWSDTGANTHTVSTLVNKTYTANFKRQFMLTMSPGTGGTSTPATGFQDSGAVVAITAIPNSGYSFSDWSGIGTGAVNNSSANPAFATIGGPITEVANFTQNPVLVTIQTIPTGLVFRVNGFTKTAPYVITFYPGQSYTISTDSIQNQTTTTQMAYKGWNDGGAISHTIFFPGKDSTISARFKPQYQVTMNSGTGGSVAPPTSFFDSASTSIISATPQAGYTFTGWTGSGNGSYTGLKNPDTITVNGPITETAGFTTSPIRVTVKSNPRGRTFTVDTATYVDSTSFIWTSTQVHTLGTPSPQSGDTVTRYFYSSWSDGGNQTHNVAPVRDTLFTVNFTTQYFLTMVAGSGGTVSPPNGWYNSGQVVGISATAGLGYGFANWTGTGAGSYTGPVNNSSVTMNAAVRESASFVPLPVQVTVTTNPFGRSVIIDTVHYTSPQVVTWSAGSVHSIGVDTTQPGTPTKQYVWISWSDTGARVHNVSTLINKTYTAKFGSQFSLTMSVDSGGTVFPGTTWQDSAKVVPISATPLTGFAFGSWTGTGAGSYTGAANPSSVTMTGPVSEVGHFTRFPAQVTVQTNVAGLSIFADDTLYTSPHTFTWQTGSSHKLSTTATQNKGVTGQQFIWSNWSDSGAMTHFVVPLKDTTFTAGFTTQYFLTMTANLGGTVSPASNWYNLGQVVTIFATPALNYSFSRWTGTGTGSYNGFNDTATVTMNSPISEVASFNRNNVTITIKTSPPGMPFTLGGPIYFTTQTFSQPPGTTFNLDAISPFAGPAGTQYVWTNWSDSGAQSHQATALTDTTFTATFRKQYFLKMAAGPGGTVAPGSTWQDSGSVVPIQGNPNSGFAFFRWDGSGSGSYAGTLNPSTVTMNGPLFDSASFSNFPVNVIVQSNPPGRITVVDGIRDSVVRHFIWTSGTPHNIGAPDTQAGGTGIRYLWTTWSDSGSKNHSISPVRDTSFTVSFATQYALTMVAGNGGTVTPPSGWYASDQHVVITATPNATYNFGAWNGSGTGSYTGNGNPDSVTMGGPITETASFALQPVNITIRTSPPGLSFTADSVTYQSPQTFVWELGVSHTIGAVSPQPGVAGTRYAWKTWSDSGQMQHTVAPVRDSIFTANFGTQFLLTTAADSGGTAAPPSAWQDSAKSLNITATPSAGWKFGSWRGAGAGAYNGTNNPATVTVRGPVQDTAAFTRFTANVTLQTNPPGLQIMVDGASYASPHTFQWTTGSTHMITAPDSQYSGSFTRYIWKTWSDSGARIHSYTAVSDTTVTANFTTQYFVTMSANPGGTVSPPSGWFASGQNVAITAFPSTGYTFTRWTGTGAGSYSGFTNPASINVNEPITEIVSFTQNSFRVTIQSNPPGRSFSVDNFTYTVTQTFLVTPGNSFLLDAPSPQSAGNGLQYVWKSWSDSGAQQHRATALSDTTFTVNFGLQYQLTTTASPSGSGTTNPPSGTFFDAGDTATVLGIGSPRFALSSWSGASSGSQNPTKVIMTSPKSLTANFSAAVQITINADSAGRNVAVDNISYTTPAVVYWLPGTAHLVDAVSPQNGMPGTRFVWKSWSDSGAVAHNVSTTHDTVLTIAYMTQYFLSMAAGGGGTVTPPSGWFPKDSSVAITAAPSPTYAFVSWSGTGIGSYSGYLPQTSIVMHGPLSETANFGHVLAAPTLVSLPTNTTNASATPTLMWHTYPGVTAYHIEISKDSLFATLAVDSVLQTDTTFVSPPLGNLTRYYWRINALAGPDVTLYSSAWNFTTLTATITARSPYINWGTGFTYPVTWISSQLSGPVNLKVSTDNGNTWRLIRSNYVNSGIAYWKVPDTQRVSNLCKYRIESSLNTSIFGESVLFAIVAGALPTTARLSTSVSFPTAPFSTDYRLASMPGVVDTLTVGDFLGGSQKTDWRLFADNGDPENYLTELNVNSRLTTGEGYWFVKKGSWTVTNFQMVLPPLDSNQALYSIPLHLGWNIIANPFDRNLAWQDVLTYNGLPASTPLVTYTGSYTSVPAMAPFGGYYFLNDSTLSLTSLVLPYPFGSVSGARSAPAPDWSVQVILTTGTNKDAENQFGIASSMKSAKNELMHHKPPLFMDQSFLYFPHPELDKTYPRYMSDIRPEIGGGQTWTFEVSNPSETRSTLRFVGIDNIPNDLRVVLINRANSAPVDLRLHPEYAYASVNKKMQFQVLVGSDAYVQAEVKKTVPEEFALGQNYPNPFNPTTSIGVQLPHDSRVKLEIYSILGQKVRTLADGMYAQGTATFTWDGTDDRHQSVATGVYFYRLTATGAPSPGNPDGVVVQSRKMILAK